MTFLHLLISNRWAQGIAVGLAFFAAIFALDRCAQYAMMTATGAGRQEERATGLQETITRTERANDAAETIRRDPDARYDECLRHARNPADC